LIAILLILLLAFSVNAQSLDPETVARAGVHDLTQKSGDVLSWNPAALGPSRDIKWSLDLPCFNTAVANDAFNVNYWNRRFGGDHYYSDADINDILNHIPSGGIRVNYQLTVPGTGLTYNKFGVRAALESSSQATLPKSLTELYLRGNELNHRYTFADFSGETQNLADYALGFGYQFEQEEIPDLYIGAAFHFYQGLFLAKTAQTDGDLTISDSLITGSTVIHGITSHRGDGVGFDLGGLAVLSDRWQVGLALRQLSSRITWDVDKNKSITWYTDSTGIIADSLGHQDYAERAIHYSDTTYSGGITDTHLPVLIEANGVFKASPKWTLLADMTVRGESSVMGDAGLEAGVAAEYSPLAWLPLQGGVSLGGPWRSRFGIGGGLRFKHYEMDLGWTWNGGIFNGASGIGFGFGQRLKF
jgi:hypothetical protein